MKYALLMLLAGCMLTVQPIDLVHPGPPYCEPVTQDWLKCRDASMREWDCRVRAGVWECELRD